MRGVEGPSRKLVALKRDVLVLLGASGDSFAPTLPIFPRQGGRRCEADGK